MGLIAYTWCEFNQGHFHYSFNRKLLDNDLSTFISTVTKLHELISVTWIKNEHVLAGVIDIICLMLEHGHGHGSCCDSSYFTAAF